MTRRTLPAETHEIACSLLRPPNTTATRGLRPGVACGARSAGSSLIGATLSAAAVADALAAYSPDVLHSRAPRPGRAVIGHGCRHRRSATATAGRPDERADRDGLDLPRGR